MEYLNILLQVLWKMAWLWVPPALVLVVYCIQEGKEDRRKRNRSEDNYLK